MTDSPSASTPPSARAVGCRALAVIGVIFRGNLERELTQAMRPRGVVDRLNVLVREWLDREHLLEHLSSRDTDLLARPLGSWEDRHLADASWHLEGVGVLLWALGFLAEVAPYDQMVELDALLPTLGIFGPTATFFERACLRETATLEQALDVAGLWEWRARVDQLQRRSGLMPAPQSLATAVSRLHLGTPPSLDDFPACGRAYRDLGLEERSLCANLARERLQALEWVCGHHAASTAAL